MQNQKLSLLMEIVAFLLFLIGLFITIAIIQGLDEFFYLPATAMIIMFSSVFILLRIKWAWYLAVLFISTLTIWWALYHILAGWIDSFFIISILFFLGMLYVLFREKKKYFNLKTSWTKKRIIFSTLIGVLILIYYGLPIVFHLFSYYHYNNIRDGILIPPLVD